MNNNHSLEALVEYFIKQEKEGDYWDFKQEWHDNNGELVKDIVCFSNTVHDKDCYLIFGVSDDFKVVGMEKSRKKQADIIDYLSNVQFAGDNLPKISVDSIKLLNGVELDVLTIYNTNMTPIYLNKPYGKMKMGCIYARVGDRNTAIDRNAEISVIENLWKKRFGLTKSVKDYIFDSLKNKSAWNETEYGYYYIYKPEYTIEETEVDFDRGQGTDEFYVYNQTDQSTSYYDLHVKANGTLLYECQIVNLDGGRLSVPVPHWGYVHFDCDERISYKYYIENDDEERLLRFMYDASNFDQRCAYNRFEKIVLFYKSEKEKEAFENYIVVNKVELKELMQDSKEYDYIETKSPKRTEDYKNSLRMSVLLKKMVEEFRNNYN